METNRKELLTDDHLNSLLNQAVFKKYPLLILGNLTQNTYYMLTSENFTSTKCSVAGTFDELIESGCSTIHDMDKDLFKKTFSRENLLKEHEKGADKVEIRVIQEGDDGQLRRVEITDFFVEDEETDDVLVVSFNRNM
jgi:hypothetical protein